VSAQPVAARYRGPSALGGDARRVANLTWTLAATDFKLRFFGSVLGYLWSLMRPLMLFGILYVIFTHVIRFGGDVKDYPVYLLSSIVLFQYFSETTGNGVRCLVERENLLRKMRFPRLVIPLSVALTALFNLGLNLIAVVIFALISGVYPTVRWLEVPLIVLALMVLSLGATMALSALFVRYRDVQPIWEVVTQLLFYGSPILYVITALPAGAQKPVLLGNPIADLLTQMRHAFVDPGAPSAATVLGGTGRLVVPMAIVTAIFALGAWVFAREAPRIAEDL
jgi:ABC-2 type transport system permease protein